ncbi:hypothetical protein [Aeoliella mucimassa]|uniref:Uncharacterized protein n=1 Tax=Aeoliella mucimassa TaxID=2527972 RepID=A0A518AP80_9BACT|nr:hypothetical protein [Aeoliella mucimassa]QDU56524.1 hypothetical protein Pan181_27340 [Aeoliella mucimassa]
MSSPPILYCRCAYAKVVPKEVKDGVLEQLVESGVAFESVADLCNMSAKRDPTLACYAQQPGLKIAACYPRAVKWLFAAAGSPLTEENVEIVNMRTLNADESCAQLLGEPSGEADNTTQETE